MQHSTIGQKHGTGRIVRVACRQNPAAETLSIREECFLMLVITHGTAVLSAYGREMTASAPCLLCFDESENPELLRGRDLQWWGVWFHPSFLNVNLSFGSLRTENFAEVAAQHDFFLLQPFLEHRAPFPLTEGHRAVFENRCLALHRELAEQPDWYWSCRARSYVMEMLIALERLCEIEPMEKKQAVAQEAVTYLETHYDRDITLDSLSAHCGVNRTTLSRCVQEVTGMTPREYLLHHRMRVAKKHLAFTDVPIKEIAARCGYKTIQHFGRMFREQEGVTPAIYRTRAVERRREELQSKDGERR